MISKSRMASVADESDNFEDQGLNTNKTLKNYDCWDEEYDLHQLIDDMRDDPGYHAKCPHFGKGQKYEWTPV